MRILPVRFRVRALALLLVPAGMVAAEDHPPIVYDFGVSGVVLEYNEHKPLFQLHTRWDRYDPADRVLLPRDFAEVNVIEEEVQKRLEFRRPPSDWPSSLTVTVTLMRLREEVEGKISVESAGEVEIRRVKFPCVDVVPTYPYDTLLMAHPMGDAMAYPTRVIGGHLGGEAAYRYPATLGMQYMVLYHRGRSYYVSAYSTGDETFEHSGQNIDGGLRLSCVWFPFLREGVWKSPACGMAVLPGGWHAAADLYRSRMGEVFRPARPPAWMRENFHGWMQVSFKGGRPDPPFRFTDIPSLYGKVEDLGLNVLHLFSWGRGGFDNDYPLRYPSENSGTVAELRAAMEQVKRRGGHVVLSTNGRLIDPDTDWNATHGGYRAYALDEKLEPYPERYAGNLFYVACPSVEAYRDALFDNVDRMLRLYGNHAAQIDQISCTPANFCWNPAHHHRTPATNWLAPAETMLKRIHEHYRSEDPDFFVWAEGTNERFGQYYEVHQGHGEEGRWTAGDSQPEQYLYTYPDAIVTGISNDISMLCHTYGQGKPFDVNLRHLDDPQFAWLLKRLVQVRKAESVYFMRGVFRDTVGVEASGDAERWWRIDRREGRGLLVNLWARGHDLKDTSEATVRLPEADWPVRAVFPEDLIVTKEGSTWRCRWTGPIATLMSEPPDDAVTR